MFKIFLMPLIDSFSFLNVFRYITFRIGLSALTAMLITLILGPWVIRKLKEFKLGQEIRKDDSAKLHELHKKKQGTPTMGGILFVLSVVSSTLIWGDLSKSYVWIAILGILFFGMIGFVDDFLKIKKKQSKGLSAKHKFLFQTILALSLGYYLMYHSDISSIASHIYLPFIKRAVIENTPWIYLLFVVLVITGSSNAVNLTDGLDGLAIGCSIVCSSVFTIITYVVGNKVFCSHLLLEYIPEAAELSIFCAAMAGAGLGFLWFNSYPAEVFMGDTGALSIGGAFGLVAILVKKEFYLILIGGVFVWEALSVILQVASYKVFKKRIFLCAPFHHHLEFKGWSEAKITIRLWIISGIFGLLGLCSLKLR
jgi:phospho-N-acetylmuramoyl-pentapeptide-transferase